MVIKVYVSGISGNKEVKKRQQRVLLILDSKNIKYEVIDIAEPGAEEAKDFMQTNSTSNGATISDPNPRHTLPPQLFNDEAYCGDYDQFDMANEIDEMEKFLKLEVSEVSESIISNAEIKLKNGDVAPDENPSKEEEKEAAAESDKKENGAPAEEETVEAEEKSKESAENEESKESEVTEVTHKNEETRELNEEESKEDQNEDSGAGDDQVDNEKVEEKSETKTKENSPETADEA